MALFMMLLISNESRNQPDLHIEILSIQDDGEFWSSILFKAVSPRNQGLPFGSRFLAELLTNRSGGHYEIEVLGEGTLGERILARYYHGTDQYRDNE